MMTGNTHPRLTDDVRALPIIIGVAIVLGSR